MKKRNSTTVKILEQMRKHSKGYKISKDAWKEMKDRIELFFEIRMQDIIRIAKKHNRHTVMEEDIIEFFSIIGNDDLNEKD